MLHKLYVCQTCRRDQRLEPGARSRGALLAQALERRLDAAQHRGVLLIRVACLNGCPTPCNVALRAPRKYQLRLSGLDAADAPDLLHVLQAYISSDSGDLDPATWPARLAGRLSARVPPPHLLARG